MGNRKLLLGLLLVVPSFFACDKPQVEDDMFDSKEILLDAAPGAPGTKGFLNDGSLTVPGTSFQMYDYLNGYNGTIFGNSNGTEFQYFSNTLTYKDNSGWKWLFGDVSNPTSYRWTRTGYHHFFGWLLNDATSSGLNTSSFFTTYNVGQKTVTLGKTLTIDVPQYDFLYSDVVLVSALGNLPDHVDIPMKHFFGALGISIKNSSTNDVVVTSVSFLNFPNSNTVTLDYSDINHVAVKHGNVAGYGDPVSASPAYFNNQLSSAITLPAQANASDRKEYDMFTGQEITSSNPRTFRMSWPVSFNIIKPVESGEQDEEGNPIYTDSSPMIQVTCRIGNNASQTLKMPFPPLDDNDGDGMFISPGKKTNLILEFLDKQIQLRFSYLPWDYEEFPMAFEGDAISSTQLKFTENTYVDGGKITVDGVKHQVINLTAASTAGDYVATGSFYIYTPVNGILSCALSGNSDDFVVSLNGGSESVTINPERAGGRIEFKIQPNGTPRRGSRVYLHFAVRNNGRDADADTEINRDHYVVVLP